MLCVAATHGNRSFLKQAKVTPSKNALLSDVCIGTSAAPTYLPAHYFWTKDANREKVRIQPHRRRCCGQQSGLLTAAFHDCVPQYHSNVMTLRAVSALICTCCIIPADNGCHDDDHGRDNHGQERGRAPVPDHSG